MPRPKEPIPAPDPDDPGFVQLQIRMPATMHKRLRRRAYRDDMSLAAIVRQFIAEGLKPKPREVAP